MSHLDLQQNKGRAKDDIVGTISRYIKLTKKGDEFVACCPFHDEDTPSFTVTPATGYYYCFGCGEGGDAIDFVSKHEGIGFAEAVNHIVGNHAGETSPVKRQSIKQPKAMDVWEQIVPVPAEAPSPNFTFNRMTATRTWMYRDAKGGRIGYVCRFDKPEGGKEVVPLTYWVNRETGEMKWRYASFSRPRPMYGLDKLAVKPDAQVLIVEGEKAADAAQKLFGDKLVVVSWPGGGKAVKFVDWSPLKGRRVGLWPDADQKVYPDRHEKAGKLMPFIEQPGTVAMMDIGAALQEVAASLKFIMPPEGVQDGWDLADELPVGFNLMAHAKSAAKTYDEFLSEYFPAPNAEPAPELVGTPEPEQEPTQNPANDNAASQSDDDAEVPEHIRAIREINKNHALALTGDKALILRETIGERFGKELQYLSVATLRTWLLNRTVPMEVIGKGGQAAIKHVPVAELWLKSAERRQYEGVTFAPANNAPDCYYNLWSGFAYEPLDCGIFNAGMKCRRLLKHMKYILCGGNSAHFRYLLAWAADMLQDPDNKKGVALVMRGLKGTGKSTFAEALASLLGRHSIKIAHMRHLTGNFNRHLADKLLVLAEESYWAGDKADEGPLKDMITSDRMTIEAKGVDAVEMPSLCRLIMITNNEWAAPATADERRYFVLDVSDRRRQDYGYFDRLYGQLEGNDSEGYRALLSLLLQFPLKSVNLRQVPETTALRQQRALSLEPHDQFIYDALIDGTLAGKDWDGFLNVGKDELYDRYIESSRKRGKTHLLTKALFGKKFMAATAATTARIRDGYERLQVYRILPREETAIHFSQHCGVDVFIDGEYNERPI
ncbi:CHC2 zinc finger domain-containing protein [Escherichia coli]|uniref:CHC2 zinc finger domain-containing protein n=1 Tax=Escherichia coli TaxID=562 RepID=UPI002FE6222C